MGGKQGRHTGELTYGPSRFFKQRQKHVPPHRQSALKLRAFAKQVQGIAKQVSETGRIVAHT